MTKQSDLVMPKKERPVKADNYFGTNNLNAHVGPELKRRMKEFSLDSGHTMSELTRFALERFLDANGH